MPLLLILFIGVPLAEIAVFIQAGELIGLWWTIATVIVTAVIGTTLVRAQGLAAWGRTQAAMRENRLPVDEVFTGLCLLVAGALLLTPGFLTDSLGFILLIPPLRKAVGLFLLTQAQKRRQFRMHSMGGQGPGGFGHPGANDPQGPRGPFGGPGDIIDGDYQEVGRDGRGRSPEDATEDPPQLPPEDRR